jgi:hypothetical protein
LLTKIEASGWNLGYLYGYKNSFWAIHRVGGRLSEEIKVKSGVPQGNVLGPLLFLAYVNDIWKNIESIIRLFIDDCIIYRNILNNNDVENLQIDLNRLGEWALFLSIFSELK